MTIHRQSYSGETRNLILRGRKSFFRKGSMPVKSLKPAHSYLKRKTGSYSVPMESPRAEWAVKNFRSAGNATIL